MPQPHSNYTNAAHPGSMPDKGQSPHSQQAARDDRRDARHQHMNVQSASKDDREHSDANAARHGAQREQHADGAKRKDEEGQIQNAENDTGRQRKKMDH